MPFQGRDGALRRPRGNIGAILRESYANRDSFRPLDAGEDIAARCPYLLKL